MNKIVTISREFGSGGREIGKRLADILGYAYYDNEIITMLAKETGLQEEYINNISEKGIYPYPFHFRKTFYTVNTLYNNQNDILIAQTKILKDIAQKGNCIIVGRGADIILKDYSPMKLFIYADLESKINRCMFKAEKNENLTKEELTKKIKEVDKNRDRFYSLLSNKKWGQKENYDLCLNTSNLQIKSIIKPLSAYIENWFKEQNI